MGEQYEARTVFGRSNTGIVGSNPTRGMDVCPRLSVSCCPVWVAAPSKDPTNCPVDS
jgi:hypothetical protein